MNRKDVKYVIMILPHCDLNVQAKNLTHMSIKRLNLLEKGATCGKVKLNEVEVIRLGSANMVIPLALLGKQKS